MVDKFVFGDGLSTLGPNPSNSCLMGKNLVDRDLFGDGLSTLGVKDA